MNQKEMCMYLGRVRNLIRKEQKLHNHINELRFSLFPPAVRYDRDKVQTSPMDQMLEVLSEIDHYERERLKVVKALIDIRSIIARKLIVLPQKEYFVLNQYYLRLQTMKEISEDLKITERHAFRLKNNGINILCKLEDTDV
jgi:DNA-directed RNA polymerase specialized sigma subunit